MKIETVCTQIVCEVPNWREISQVHNNNNILLLKQLAGIVPKQRCHFDAILQKLLY